MMNLSLSRKRFIARLLILVMVAQLVAPYQSYALTGGPSQPEVQSFEPIGTSEMVDVSSGSFNYNIPLLEVGGYPINLAYHAGATPDDEATVCGLGWNINPGVINRNMRGLPDDFNGDDKIEKEFNIKPNQTWGGSLGSKFEVFGASKAKGKAGSGFNISSSLGIFYNNYKGVGFEFGIMPGFSAGQKGSNMASFGLGLTANSQSGITVSPTASFSATSKEIEHRGDKGNLNGGLSIGSPVNSRSGLSALTIGTSLGISGSGVRTASGTDEAGYAISKRQDIAFKHSLFGGSSSFSFAAPSFSPQITMPFQNFSYSTTFSIGLEIAGVHPGASVTGYYSEQRLSRNKIKSPAFGYLYAEKGQGREAGLMDFNREKDGPFTKHTPHLPPVVFTNDVYGVTGQGIAGSYQLRRGDIGVLSDARMQNTGAGGSTGFEIGFGAPPGVHGGGDIVVNVTNSNSGRWSKNNSAAPLLALKPAGADPNYETAYFKMAGDKSVETDPGFFTQNGGKEPVRVHLDKGGVTNMNVEAANYLETEGNVKYPIKHSQRLRRERRNQSISYLTAKEATNFGLEKKIINHKINRYEPTDTTEIGRTEGFRQGHHLSEITVLRQDGLRYIYGIPAYNVSQEELSFSVNTTGNCRDGLVNYSATEASVGNASGEDNYFNKVTTPAYAHSYLLTAIVSQDYVDLSGDGPTPDDFGTYTKFNYTRYYADYNWRIPHQPGTANFNEGFKSTDDDNKANFVAGVKEYWVLNAVVSKTQVAEFTYDIQNRPDAQSSSGQKLPRLDKITLYSLPDRRYNNASTPVPIKTVHFEYDNSLCPGLPYFPANSPIGKLTLTKLWFTYGDSQKGKLSPYQFEYGQRWNGQVINPPYNLKAYNRWGSYQENKGAAGTGCYNHPESAILNTSDYPYVPQDSAQANANVVAYNLTKIKLPSGGVIKVEYEANRYAYTQDRRAMEMIDVVGTDSHLPASFNPNTLSNTLYSSASLPPSHNNFLFFKLRKPILPPNADQELWKQYLEGAFGDKGKDDGYLYFKFLVNVGQFSKPQYEYVPGYAQINRYGVVPGNPNYGYVELSEVPVGDLKLPAGIANSLGINQAIMTNPIAKSAWQFTRLYLPKIAYGQSSANTQMSDEDIITGLAKSITKQAAQFAMGFNNFMFANNYSRQFVQGKSWIRLCSPEKNKLAGGARVKSIRISDEWGAMAPSAGKTFTYGQDYDYTTVENGDTISSGVASYEPMPGGDENPFRQPEFYKEQAILAPDNRFYQEQPFGESFFPAPQIVYGKVTVRNRPHPGVTRTATGWVVQEFYTARDFPTKTDNTGVLAIPKKTNPIFKQLLLKHKDYMTASEGFVIELNDMSGKPKAQWVYDEGGTRLSGVEYKYKRNGDRLVNEDIPTIDPAGNVLKAVVGLESSMVSDSREMYSKTRTAGVQLNTDNFLAGVYPVLTVIPLPSYHVEETRFRSMAITKVIQRYGLLEKTIAYDLGASVSTENIAWDAETGEVILTRTENEFHDPIYTLNIPAHLGYEGMRGAYQNLRAEFAITTDNKGIYTNAKYQHFFTPGDELIPASGVQKLWVKDVNRLNGAIFLIDENGQAAISVSGTFKIARSGRRNQQLSSIGSVATLKMPVSNTGRFLDLSGKDILNASAVEYSDRWQTWCTGKDDGACSSFPGGTTPVNPYRTNNRGVFRPLRNWTFLTDRRQNIAGVNIRTDGPFTTFSPFWKMPAMLQRIEGYPVWSRNPAGWTWTSEVTRYNPVGNELENRDTLNRYSAELTGYANTQVVASAKNTRYRQIAFEGFEDYVFETNFPKSGCYKRHIEFDPASGFNPNQVKQGVSHSGKYALELAATQQATINAAIDLSSCPAPLAAKPANATFKLDKCDCVGVFSPDPGTYIFSAWVREDRANNTLSFSQARVLITVAGPAPQTTTLKAEGPIIEGWQRISGEFIVPANSAGISVSLLAANNATTWFDDLRIHPFDASFKSYVYDDVSLKFTYELDENNFFTKYEYDQQGMLERVKKETERGVMTIQESLFGQQKN